MQEYNIMSINIIFNMIIRAVSTAMFLMALQGIATKINYILAIILEHFFNINIHIYII